MKPICEINEVDVEAEVLKSRQPVFDNRYLLPRHFNEPSQTRRTLMQRAPQVVKPVRRIIISWVESSPFQPKFHSAVPIYPRVPSLRIKRRMIRRHISF